MKLKTEVIRLEKILADGYVGPFHVGMTLTDIGLAARAPDHWGFAPGADLNFYLLFNHVELYLEGAGNNAVVNYFRINKFRFRRGFYLRLAKSRLYVSVPAYWDEPERAKETLERLNMAFTEGFEEPVKDHTYCAINLPNGVRLYYSNYPGDGVRLATIEVGGRSRPG